MNWRFAVGECLPIQVFPTKENSDNVGPLIAVLWESQAQKKKKYGEDGYLSITKLNHTQNTQNRIHKNGSFTAEDKYTKNNIQSLIISNHQSSSRSI